MNQIAGVDGFSLMNNLRLVVIVAIFIILIIVLFYNRILGSPKRAKQKDKQVVNPSDDSGREEQHATDVVDDFFGKEESKEKEISKGGESTAESEVVIDDQPAVNYEKIETDLKAVRDEVTTKIEGLISKVEAVEKEVLNKIEDVIDAKIQEASNKINDRISEAVRTQMNSINSISEERVDSLRKEEEPVGIPSTEEPKELVEEKVEFEEKKKSDLEAVKDSDIMEKVHLFVRYQLDAFDILPLDEAKTVAEVKKDVKVDEKKLIESITSTGEIEEKISERGVGESVGPARLFFQKFLSIGIPFTKESKELLEEGDLEAPVKDSGILEKLYLFVRNQLGAFGILPSGESKTVAEEKKERDLEASVEDSDVLGKLAGSLQISEDSFDVLLSEDTVLPEEIKEEEQADTMGIEEKISEGDVGESVDFDIEKLLEEEPVGMSSTEESREVEEKVKFKEEKEEGSELPAEETAAHEEIDEEEIDTIAPRDIEERALEAAKGEETEEKKQFTEEASDFDIQEFLEELGTPPSGKDLKSEKE